MFVEIHEGKILPLKDRNSWTVPNDVMMTCVTSYSNEKRPRDLPKGEHEKQKMGKVLQPKILRQNNTLQVNNNNNNNKQ